MPTPEQISKAAEDYRPEFPPLNMTPMVGRWTRFCWWLSRRLGGRTVFGKRDES